MFCIAFGACFVPVLSFNLLSVLIRYMANGMRSLFIKSVDDIKVRRPVNALEERIRIRNELREKVRYSSILQILLSGMYNQLHK